MKMPPDSVHRLPKGALKPGCVSRIFFQAAETAGHEQWTVFPGCWFLRVPYGFSHREGRGVYYCFYWCSGFLWQFVYSERSPNFLAVSYSYCGGFIFRGTVQRKLDLEDVRMRIAGFSRRPSCTIGLSRPLKPDRLDTRCFLCLGTGLARCRRDVQAMARLHQNGAALQACSMALAPVAFSMLGRWRRLVSLGIDGDQLVAFSKYLENAVCGTTPKQFHSSMAKHFF